MKRNMFWRHILVQPFIWSLLIPVLILDFFSELYHQIGFRLCKIPLVKRSKYIKIDRHKLKYISFFAKIACIYCGYVNGFANYSVEIFARTEQYWCAVQHKKTKGFIPPKHHKGFAKYGDKKTYRKQLWK